MEESEVEEITANILNEGLNDPNHEQSSEHSLLLKGQRKNGDHGQMQSRKQYALILVGIIIFCVIYLLPVLKQHPCAHSCLAIVFMVCFYWITECIPSFVASYLIPIFSVFLRIGVDPKTGERISAPQLATIFAAKFMDPVILVFLGSLTMSMGLSKLEITSRLSKFVLSNIPSSRPIVLLTLMLINVFVASLLSNVASSTLTLSLAMPIMQSLDNFDPFNKALLFGIAWSGNCGGMTTIIASPQNIIASAVVASTGKTVTFMEWIMFAGPVSILLTFAFWGYLCSRFIKENDNHIRLSHAPSRAPWGIQHTLASIVTITTILMWSFGGQIGWFMGHTGIAALIPVVFFFGSGILEAEEFSNIRWSTLVLLGGGLALGEAMKISRLLTLIGDFAKPLLKNVSLGVLLLCLLSAEGIFASILSSTTAASILFPLILAVSDGIGHGPLLVCLSALMISVSQLFHISSFPNALVSGVTEQNTISGDLEKTYLRGIDFINYGWPTILMGILVISTAGFMITSALGL